MGTRADFYIGKGAEAKWLGSVGWDGDEWLGDSPLMLAKTPEEFQLAVDVISGERDDFTEPAQGWPWPWDDSNTTDMAYMLIDGEVIAYDYGRKYSRSEQGGWQYEGYKSAEFPDMAARKDVTRGPRSGLITG